MLKKSYKPIDLLLAAVYAQTKGRTNKAASLFVKASKHPDMEAAWSELNKMQEIAHKRVHAKPSTSKLQSAPSIN